MDADSDQDGLRQGVVSMVALESLLEERLAALSTELERYLEAPIVIGELRSLVTAQREGLEAHLQELGDTDVPLVGLESDQGTVAALREVAAAFTEASLAYGVLHGVAHRFFQKPTADLAEQHQSNYLWAAQVLHHAVGDVVVQELQDAGHTCRCQCPACGPGICICWHVHVEPEVTGAGIVVRAPRADSNAERAGLRHGDLVLAVDGHEVRSYQDMRDRMGEHQPGESVKLRVRRGTGDPEELVVTR